jgi:beta-glucosidase
MAEEARALGVSVILGPGINLKRHPLCGRNFEYFSEDALLTYRMAVGMIRGIQDKGVAACPKHFAVNNQETRRMTIDAIVDEKTLREVYLRPFKGILDYVTPACMMTAYNRVNGHYASEHPHLLATILREQWAYDGVVVSDWGGTNDRTAALIAGLDLEMPGSEGFHDEELLSAVERGQLDEAIIDRSLRRILHLILNTAPEPTKAFSGHHELARRAAARSVVLAKNDRHLLPISGEERIAVIGPLAIDPRYQGAGSSKINPLRLDRPLEAMKRQGLDVTYSPGYLLDRDRKEREHFARALQLAGERDLVLFFCGLPDHFESEGFDRKHLDLPDNQVELLEALHTVNDRVVVLYMGGGPVSTGWIDRVHSLMILYLGGEAIGSALVDLLTGRENPSGRLAETWFRRLEEIPSFPYFPGGKDRVHYREGPFIGYAGVKSPVCFPFGHGLSYTTFTYGPLFLEQDEKGRRVRLVVSNRGPRPGFHTLLLFARPMGEKQNGGPEALVGFERIYLEVHGSSTVTIAIARDAFLRYDPVGQRMVEAGGHFLLTVGTQETSLQVEGPVLQAAGLEALIHHRLTGGTHEVPDEVFRVMLGREPPPLTEKKRGPIDANTILQDVGVTLFGRFLRGFVHLALLIAVSGSLHTRRMLSAMAMELPLRSLGLMGGPFFTARRLNGIIDLLNNRRLEGLKKLFFKGKESSP